MMQYTDDQKKAIQERGRNILVAAAAGSGKTRVLVDRIIGRLLKHECSIDELLVVTFTNAAAAEMRERIGAALEAELSEAETPQEISWLDRQSVLLTGASISTFHVFCQRVIRQNIEAIDVDPQFRLAGEQEVVLMKQDVLEELLEEHYHEPERESFDSEEAYLAEREKWQEFLAFVDDYGNDHGDDEVYKAVLSLYEFSQSQPLPEAWLRKQSERYQVVSGVSIWETSWGKELWARIEEGRRAVEAQGDDFAHWLKEGALQEVGAMEREAVAAALAPYGEVLQKTLAAIDDIFQVGQDWQGLSEAFSAFKPGKLSSAKVLRPLKEDYPALRAAFEVKHDSLKAAVKALGKDYFRYTEEETLAMLKECAPTIRRFTSLTLDFMAALRQAKQERNVLDFNDLEHYALQILCADEEGLLAEVPRYVPSEAALECRKKFVEVMVDEYQDTNSVQEAILSLVARPRSRFTVGDVKQSIYRFRLANPYLFQRQYESFPLKPTEKDENELITMRQNFRSRKEVLAPINYLFDQIMHREPMEIEYDEQSKLYPGADFPEAEGTIKGGLDIDLILLNDSKEEDSSDEEDEAEELTGFALEAQQIACRIEELIAKGCKVYEGGKYRPIMYRDMAVLLRAMKGKAEVLLETFRKHSIPAYADVSGGYFKAPEVSLMLDLLSIVDNARQDIPLAAVLASPLGGFTMEELAKLRVSSEEDDLYGALLTAQEMESGLEPELAAKAAAFQVRLASWRSFVVSHSVPEMIWKLYRETGYYDYVGGLKGGLLKQANLRMLADRAADYEKTNYRGLFRFLRFIEELKKRETDLAVARTLGDSENVVRIMSIHKSKGLEFPVVFVSDLGKQFNLNDAKGTFLYHQEVGIGPQLVERSKAGRQQYQTLPWKLIQRRITAESKAEEMRVLYVAMTRAKEKLILTGTLKANKEQIGRVAAGFCRGVGREEAALPETVLKSAKGVLEWILLSAARHQGGRKLRELAGLPATLLDWSLDLEPGAEFNLNLIPGAELQDGKQAAEESDPILQAVEAGEPLPDTEKRDIVRERLGWLYDSRGLEQVSAKASVTELKARSWQEQAKEEIYSTLPLAAGSSAGLVLEEEWSRPRFLQQNQEKKAFTPAERGTLMHTALQHIDFHTPAEYAAVRKQLEKMEMAGIFQPGECQAVDGGKIVNLLSSPLGEMLRKARHIYREQPFCRLLPASRFYPEAKDPEARIFLQGVIDLLFEDEQGRLVLVDYKTDRGLTGNQAIERYKTQLSLYQESVAELLSRKVDRCYLYLLQNGIMAEL